MPFFKSATNISGIITPEYLCFKSTYYSAFFEAQTVSTLGVAEPKTQGIPPFAAIHHIPAWYLGADPVAYN